MHENSKNTNMSTGFSYENMIKKVAEDVCNEEGIPTCAKYEKAVVKIINDENNFELEPRLIHSTIHRALQRLVGKNSFFKAKKAYYPDIPKYRRMYYGSQIKEQIRLASNEVHHISDNTCAITLERLFINDSECVSNQEIINLFENFIGKNNYYEVKLLDNLLIVMLREKLLDDETGMEHIKELIRVVYEEQSKRRVKLTSKGILQKALNGEYNYYWFDKDVTYEDGTKQVRRFLMLQCAPEIIHNAYNIICNYYGGLFESIYRGFGGMVIIFDVTTETCFFDRFVNYIRKDEPEDSCTHET